jgi:toluene monooxygenase system protein A
MLPREAWLNLARKLDWTFRYASPDEIFPAEPTGETRVPPAAWGDWDEPFKTSYREYVSAQSEKERAVRAVRDAVGRPEHTRRVPKSWLSVNKFHGAALPLAEFAATIGNLRAGRFARDSAWRTMALFGAMDELRHTEIPLLLYHDLVKWDPQFDWVHRFYHTNNWVAIAARHLMDELLLAANPIEFAIGTNLVFETGFTNLQFVALSALARDAGDPMFETMVKSIQTDEARHAQIGRSVLEILARDDREYAQRLVDKWFWRTWHLFSVLTGFSMDYLTPLPARRASFKEFVDEWIVTQFFEMLDAHGLERPWYWDTFETSLDYYHHMVYASAYTYRTTVWFDFVVPGPQERAWLAQKYPDSWPAFAPVWERIDAGWRESDPDLDFAAHGSAIVTFCDTCQLVLCEGTPANNSAQTLVRGEQKYIFCSEPCRWIFEQEPERYARHRDVVKRVLAGEAPGNLAAILTQYFGLTQETWGRDVHGGRYDWLARPAKVRPDLPGAAEAPDERRP